MKRSLLLAALLLGACATPAPAPSQGPPDCTSNALQKTLTYCVSPAAARVARDNDEVRRAVAKGLVNPKIFPLPLDDSPTLGPDSAAITLVIFTELGCDACATSFTHLARLAQSHPDDVRLVFKHIPKDAKSLPASLASLAAARQGKFWEFVAAVFSSPNPMTPKLFTRVISELGGDPKTFEKDLADPALRARVGRDVSLARALGISASPTIFLNGMPIPTGVPFQEFVPVIAQQRAIARAFLDAGVPASEIYWRVVRAQYQPVAPPAQQAPDPDAPRVVYVPTLDSPMRGARVEDALVTITLFSDFECPFCRQANPTLESALALAPGKIRVVFKHFPLPIHERADNAAGLAILAGTKGKFWEMHDLLFQNQDKLSNADLQRHADTLGLGIKDVNAAMKDPKLVSRIERDMTMGIQLGINATPTMLINGVMFLGAPEPAELKSLILEQLKLAEALRKKTGKSGELLHRALVEANGTTR